MGLGPSGDALLFSGLESLGGSCRLLGNGEWAAMAMAWAPQMGNRGHAVFGFAQ